MFPYTKSMFPFTFKNSYLIRESFLMFTGVELTENICHLKKGETFQFVQLNYRSGSLFFRKYSNVITEHDFTVKTYFLNG